MFRSKRAIALLLISLIAISLLGVACTPQRRPEQQPGNRQNTPNQTPTDPAQDPMTGPKDNANERSKRTADRIKKDVPEVRDVSVVFADRVVYVAMSLDQDVSEKRAKDIETLASEKVMDEENTVDRVYVSLDPETFKRLQGVARDVEDGKPISGLLNQVEELFSRITPTTRR